MPPQWMLNFSDTAALHVVDLIESDVQGERLFAVATTFNYSKLVRMLQQMGLSKTHYPPGSGDEGEDWSTIDVCRSVELLQR